MKRLMIMLLVVLVGCGKPQQKPVFKIAENLTKEFSTCDAMEPPFDAKCGVVPTYSRNNGVHPVGNGEIGYKESAIATVRTPREEFRALPLEQRKKLMTERVRKMGYEWEVECEGKTMFIGVAEKKNVKFGTREADLYETFIVRETTQEAALEELYLFVGDRNEDASMGRYYYPVGYDQANQINAFAPKVSAMRDICPPKWSGK